MFLRTSILAAAADLTCPIAAHAAESYDSCVGFIDSIPAVISTQGTWCLRRDLSTSMASGSAITVSANNVTIDCNDFKLGGLAAGNATTTKGINAMGRLNVAVRNCSVRGFLMGIAMEGGGTYTVEDKLFLKKPWVFTCVSRRGLERSLMSHTLKPPSW